MKFYTVQETAEKLGISKRAVQKRCKRQDIRKKGNRYLITSEHLKAWQLERTQSELSTYSSEPTNEPRNEPQNKSFVGYLAVKQENTKLKDRIKELLQELEQYQIAPNERIEVFTDAEYQILETRLQEWHTQQQELNHKEQIFEVEKKSLRELLEHYKTQFEYQKGQSERILDMHQHLIDTIQKQTAISLQRNILEAKDKDIL